MASAFQSSAFQQNAFQTRVDQTVSVTGVSATGAVGSVTVSGKANVPVTGVFATGAVGSVTVTGKANVPVTGVFATGATGTVVVTGKANVFVTGVSATGFVGSVTVTGVTNVFVTGVSATGFVGSVSVTGKANVSVTKVSATGAVGSVVATGKANVSVTGVFATGAVGSVTVTGKANVSVTGVFATGATGTVVVTGKANVFVTGVSATSQLGSISVSDNEIVPVTGVFATGATGTVVVTGKANVSVTGVSATGQTGSVTVSGSAVISLTGVTATGETGSVVVSVVISVPVTGVTATGFVSSVSVFGTAIVAPTGPPAYGYVGSVTVLGSAVVPVTGLSATSSLGTVSVTGTASVSLSGVTATGFVGSVVVVSTANVPVTGVSATGQTGTVTVSGNAVVLLTGVTATASLGTVSVTGTAVVGLTGVSATAELGNISITANGNVSINISGVTGTGETGTVSVSANAIFSVTGVSGTTLLGSVTVIEGVGVTVLVTGVSATSELGSVIVSVPVLVTGVEATGVVGTVTVFAQANIVVIPVGVQATGFIGNAEANPALDVPVTGVFATGYVGSISSWITVDDFQECDWGDIPEGAASDWIPIEPCINDAPWVNPIETVQFVPAAIPNWEQPSNSEDSEMHSWVPVPIGASNSWTTISPCDPRVDMDIALAGIFATGEIGVVTSGSVLIVPLNNTNLLTTGQVGSVVATGATGVTGVSASGFVGLVEVELTNAELVVLFRPWTEGINSYDPYNPSPYIFSGFPNYLSDLGNSPIEQKSISSLTFELTQAPLIIPNYVWRNYFDSTVYDNTVVKNYNYSLQVLSFYYNQGPASFIYPYPSFLESTYKYFDVITGDFTQEIWIYRDSNVESGYYFDIISNGSNYQLIINDNEELQLDIYYNENTYTISGGTVPVNSWVHLAMSRSGSSLRLFIDGILIATLTFSDPMGDSPGVHYIVASLPESYEPIYSIRIDSYRWINGLALYTSNFTPPAYFSPYFSDVVGLYMVASLGTVFVSVPTLVSLVTPWNGGLGSTSSYPNFTVANATNTGFNVSTASDVFDAVQAPMVTPDWLWFEDSLTTLTYYNASIVKNYNYSVRFPGLYGSDIRTNIPPRSNDAIASGFNSGFTQKFTCEAWVYISYATPPTVEITFISLGELSGVYNVSLKSTSDRKLQLTIFEGDPVYDYVVDISGGTIPYNSWTHLALNVDGSSIKIFINGTEVASVSYDWYVPNTTYQITLLQYIGYSSPATIVYLDSFRLIGVTSLYPSNFTPPAYFSPYFSDVVGLYMVTSVGTVTVPEP